MEINQRFLIFLFFSSFVWSSSSGQQKDFVTMHQLAISHDFNASVYAEFFQQAMFYENSSELWMNSSDIGAGIKLNKAFSTELHYRNITFKRQNNQFENRNLIYHTLTYQRKVGKLLLSIRNRAQQLSFAEHFNDNYRSPRWYDRVRLNLSYRYNYYWSCGANGELFFPLNNKDRTGLDQYRIGTSLTRRFNNRFSTAATYQMQQQVGRSGNNTFFVLGLQVNIQI
jgi:hypothetical protein